MANDNIFQQYLAPPKSVLDYSAELDQADARRQAFQQNALTLAAGQQKFDEQREATQRGALVRAALAGLPKEATDDQRIQAMRATGTPEGFAAADALGKAIVEQRKGNAAAGKDEADAFTTNYKLKVAKHDQAIRDMSSFQTPQDALTSLRQHVASGELPAEQADVFAQQLQTMNPADFPKWQLGMVRQLMSAKDQMSYMAPDANTVANNERIRSEGQANRANQITVQKMIGDRMASGDDNDGSGLSDATKKRIAMQFVDAGDTSGMKNVGRGAQGAKDLRGIQNAITDYAASKGMAPSEISAKIADFEGLKNGLRTSANISARVENAISEAKELAPLAIAAGREVGRSNILPFGRVQMMFNTQTNDPALKKFATANNGLVTAYAGAMARGQKPTQASFDHAQHILSEAQDQASYEAAVNQLYAEMDAASRAPQNVREHLRGQISGQGGAHGAESAPSTNAGVPDDIAALLKKHGSK